MFAGSFVTHTKFCCSPGQTQCNETNLKEINYSKIAFCILYIIVVAIFYGPKVRGLAIDMRQKTDKKPQS